MKVGDYVRYKYENSIYIGKIKFISEVMGFEETLQLDIDNCIEEILKEDIIKSSPNIIDLIEVGDYVNGCLVLHKENNELVCGLLLRYKEENIQNVVTKEQFENMEYKVNK